MSIESHSLCKKKTWGRIGDKNQKHHLLRMFKEVLETTCSATICNYILLMPVHVKIEWNKAPHTIRIRTYHASAYLKCLSSTNVNLLASLLLHVESLLDTSQREFTTEVQKTNGLGLFCWTTPWLTMCSQMVHNMFESTNHPKIFESLYIVRIIHDR